MYIRTGREFSGGRYVRETILAPTDGIVFFAHTEALISEKDIAYRLIHRLHE